MFWKYLSSGLFLQKSILPLQNQGFVLKLLISSSWRTCVLKTLYQHDWHCFCVYAHERVLYFGLFEILSETCTKYDTAVAGPDHPSNVLWFLESTNEWSDGLTHESNQRRSSLENTVSLNSFALKGMEALRSVFPQHNSPSKKKRSFFKRKITSSIAVLKFWRAEKVCAGVWTSWFLNCEEKRKREMLLRKNQFRFWLGGPKFVRYTSRLTNEAMVWLMSLTKDEVHWKTLSLWIRSHWKEWKHCKVSNLFGIL